MSLLVRLAEGALLMTCEPGGDIHHLPIPLAGF